MLDQLANGILLGAIVAMASVGLSLVFNVAGVFNFAHGDMVAVGAMFAVLLAQAAGLPLWLALSGAIVMTAALGWLLDAIVFKPLRRKRIGGITMLVTTLGLALIIRYVMLAIVGPNQVALPLPPQRIKSYLGLGFTDMGLVVIVLTIVLLVGFALFLLRSETGTAMRAVASNRTLAESCGINSDRIITLSWVISGGLAAAGGIMLALTQLVYWNMGFQLLLLMFAGVILGGLRSPFGAMAGGFAIGVVTQLSVALPYVSTHTDLKIAVSLLVMSLILLIRPQGLLSRRARVS